MTFSYAKKHSLGLQSEPEVQKFFVNSSQHLIIPGNLENPFCYKIFHCYQLYCGIYLQ